MLSQIFLILIFLVSPITSGGKFAEKLAKCTDIYSAFEKSSDLPGMLTQVSRWKMEFDGIELLDDARAVGMASDLEKCQAKVKNMKPNNFAKFIVNHMHDLFMMKKENAYAESRLKEMKREKEMLHETIGKMAKKIAFCKWKIAEMEQNNGTMAKVMEQKDGEIIKLKVMARTKDAQFAKEVKQEKQMGIKLAKQLQEEQSMHAVCGQTKDELLNSKDNWKIATFVLTGGVALLLLILAIAVALFLKAHCKA